MVEWEGAEWCEVIYKDRAVRLSRDEMMQQTGWIQKTSLRGGLVLHKAQSTLFGLPHA